MGLLSTWFCRASQLHLVTTSVSYAHVLGLLSIWFCRALQLLSFPTSVPFTIRDGSAVYMVLPHYTEFASEHVCIPVTLLNLLRPL